MVKKDKSIKKSNKKKTLTVSILSVIISISILSLVSISNDQNYKTSELSMTSKVMDDYIKQISKTHSYFAPQQNSYFDFYLSYDDFNRFQNGIGAPLDGIRIVLKDSVSSELVEQFKPDSEVVVIFPIFTAVAYQESGFYAYYAGNCDDSCVTDVQIKNPKFDYNGSGASAQILYHLGYDFLTDIQVDQNPELLTHYDTVILLHNEYVTKKEFDAISSHPNLIFLYPNALYAQIEANYNKNTITLIRGHDYPPDDPVKNGFNYEIEKQFHHYEYDNQCIEWEFIEIENGYHLNCYPDNEIFRDLDLLNTLTKLLNSN